ncbi:MAG: hypothetical protein ACXVGB_02875 [Mycobacteriaceae bacterium]
MREHRSQTANQQNLETSLRRVGGVTATRYGLREGLLTESFQVVHIT